MRKRRVIQLLLVCFLWLMPPMPIQAATDTPASLDVMVSSYDVYDVVPWHEMKQDLYIGSMPNESPSCSNKYEKMLSGFEEEKPQFAIVWLLFQILAQCDGLRIDHMQFRTQHTSGEMLCKTYSNHFWLGTGRNRGIRFSNAPLPPQQTICNTAPYPL